MKNILTVTVAIPAYNEELNIQTALKAVSKQKGSSYVIKTIVVISDGSRDNTVDKVREIKDKRIKVLSHKNRIGKAQSLNEIFRTAKTDVIVVLDADVIPQSSNTIEELVKPFTIYKGLGYVGGKLVPLPAKSFIEKTVQVSRLTWDKLRNVLEDGNSVYSCSGGVYALSKKFALQSLFPNSVWVDTGFFYFKCKEKGFKFFSSKKAEVLFRTPSTIRDYISQISRYTSENRALDNIYAPEIVSKAYQIPKKLLYRYKLEVFVSYPLHCLILFVLNAYVKYTKNNKQTGQWQVSTSTKQNIQYEKS